MSLILLRRTLLRSHSGNFGSRTRTQRRERGYCQGRKITGILEVFPCAGQRTMRGLLGSEVGFGHAHFGRLHLPNRPQEEIGTQSHH